MYFAPPWHELPLYEVYFTAKAQRTQRFFLLIYRHCLAGVVVCFTLEHTYHYRLLTDLRLVKISED